MHQSQALYIQIQEDMLAVNIGDKTFPKTIVNPSHPNISMHILHYSLYISYGTDKEFFQHLQILRFSIIL